jgi:phosphoglycolate phosphatase
MTTILFDLDGTLVDSTAIVLPVFKQTLQTFGRPAPDDAVLRRTFGMPDEEIWKMLMPDSDAETRKAAFEASERDVVAGMFKTDIMIANAREVLETLWSCGHTLTTASNCGNQYLAAVLDSQDIRRFFTAPLCLEAVHGTAKADILTTHFRQFDRCDTVMVGDRFSDVEAAHHHNVPVVGCLVGFGNQSELAEADFIISDLRELVPLFPAKSAHLVPHRRGEFSNRLNE